MNRRQFIHICNALGAASLWPMDSLAHIPSGAPVERIGSIELIDAPEDASYDTRLGLVAVGGVGSACLRDMAAKLSDFYRVIAINTDADALQEVQADRKIRVGHFTSPCRDPQQVAQLALAAHPQLAHAVAGLDMVLLVSGMGGGAGTGISPVVSQVLRQQGTATLGFAVMPFDFEGYQRQMTAQEGLLALQRQLPALIVARNTDVAQACNGATPMDRVLRQAPQAFAQLCRSMGQLVPKPQNLLNFDVQDLQQQIMPHKGVGAFGFGAATLAQGAVVAVQKAMAHPLLGLQRLRQARAALVAMEVPPSILKLIDSRAAMALVRSHLSPGADVIYASAYGPMPVGETFRVSIWAHGLAELDARPVVRNAL